MESSQIYLKDGENYNNQLIPGGQQKVVESAGYLKFHDEEPQGHMTVFAIEMSFVGFWQSI